MKKVKSILAVMLIFILSFSLVACGGNAGIDNDPEPEITKSTVQTTDENSSNDGENSDSKTDVISNADNTANESTIEEDKSDIKSLVVYFSWSGNLQKMSRWVADETGSDIYRVTPKEAYDTEYEGCADRAKNEVDNGIRPELSNLLDSDVMAEYDVIYVGFPIWWYDLPMPMVSFLESYDLSGKTIIPFFSHNGSSDGAGSLDTLEEISANSTVLTDQVLSVKDGNVDSSEQEVRDWVNGLVF
jgi:flavodoxin